MFDVPLSEKAKRTFSCEIPDISEEWRVGVIVGPSGSGKSTIARHVYGDDLYSPGDWPKDKAVLDGMNAESVKDITEALTAVGFSSPPSWVKPYDVLSNGEKFRCDLAQALLLKTPLIVFDEFTSVVDRTVAKIGSAAISKAIRRSQGRRFIAVTCHYDVAEWLEADWVLDMGTGQLARGKLRRPEIRIEVFRCKHAAWRLFGPHHYLNASLNKSARCYLATWEGEPIAMVGVLNAWGYSGYERISRVVTLPDYQGIGIARRVIHFVAQHLIDGGAKRVSLGTGHPAMIHSLSKSPDWKPTVILKTGSRQQNARKKTASSMGRSIVRFTFQSHQMPERQHQKDLTAPAPETALPRWHPKFPKQNLEASRETGRVKNPQQDQGAAKP